MTRTMQNAELGDILTAIREVEHSLDRRADRVGGALMITWGVIVALIAAFYQLVMWNPDAYHAALGPFLHWAWAAPVAVGYAAGVLLGVRGSAHSPDPDARRQALLDFAPAIVSTLIVVGLVLAARYALIPGALLLGFSVSLPMRCGLANAPPGYVRAAWGAAGVCAAVGVAFLVWPVVWAWWVTGVVFGGFLVWLGMLRMARA